MADTRIALVTGATAGLGRAVAGALADHGMDVLVHGRDAKRAAAVVDQISKSGGTARAVLADLASLDQVRELADRTGPGHRHRALLRRQDRGQSTRRNLRSGDPVPAAHGHRRTAGALPDEQRPSHPIAEAPYQPGHGRRPG